MVAATFDRTRFSCADCEEAGARGGDLRFSNSGAPGACDGPREWEFFKRHPTRGFKWTGCPRRSLSARVNAWIDLYDRCDGKLSATEARQAPALLLGAFSALDTVSAMKQWEAIENAKAQSKG